MKTHYGWLIVACAFGVLAVSNGMTLIGLTAFDPSLLAEFGWSKGELKTREALQFMLAGLAGPFIGALADKYGVRRLMILGMLCLSGGLFAYAFIANLQHVYLIHVFFGICMATAGLAVNVLLVSRWFSAKRGTAIGLAMVGTSLGSTFFAKFNTMVLDWAGSWQAGFRLIALFPLLVLPVIVFVIKEWPADKGLKPFGADQDQAATPAGNGELPGISYQQALRSANFWLLGAIAMFTFYAILGVVANLFLFLVGNGVPLGEAGSKISIIFIMSLIGKFAWGSIADFVSPKKVFLINLLVMLAGAACLSSMNLGLFWPFVILFGLGWGGIYTMIQLMVVENFGLKAAGKILGTMTLLEAIGGGLGPVVSGALADQYGNYQVAFLVVAVLILLSFFAALMIRPVVKH